MVLYPAEHTRKIDDIPAAVRREAARMMTEITTSDGTIEWIEGLPAGLKTDDWALFHAGAPRGWACIQRSVLTIRHPRRNCC